MHGEVIVEAWKRILSPIWLANTSIYISDVVDWHLRMDLISHFLFTGYYSEKAERVGVWFT